MARTTGVISVDPQGHSMVVDIDVFGARATVYTTHAGTSAITLPATITTPTDFYVSVADADYTVSALIGSVECLEGTRGVVRVGEGCRAAFSPGLSGSDAGEASASGGSVAVVTQAEITVTEVATAAHHLTAAITAVDTVAKTFTVAGDKMHLFPVGLTVTVTGSTGNNGTYTVLGPARSGADTLVYVNEVVPDATADGTLNATVGLYQGTLALPANSAVQEVVGYLTGAPWAADLALLNIGDDVTSSVGFVTAFDLLTNVDLYAGATGVGGTSPTWSADTGTYSSDWHNFGVRYPTGANVLVTVVTQITSPPATPTGSLIVGIRYVTGVVPVAATATVT